MESDEMTGQVIPVYKFEWESGLERSSEDLEKQYPDAIENLATLGKEDPDCEVLFQGFKSK